MTEYNDHTHEGDYIDKGETESQSFDFNSMLNDDQKQTIATVVNVGKKVVSTAGADKILIGAGVLSLVAGAAIYTSKHFNETK